MITGVLIGWKDNKPKLIEASNKIGTMIKKFKDLNLELANGKSKYSKLELFKSAFKTAVSKKTPQIVDKSDNSGNPDDSNDLDDTSEGLL